MHILTSQATLTREQQLRAVFSELTISHTHLTAVQLYGSSQPYHNWAHCAVVALHCYEAGKLDNVSHAELRTLVLAALYHDYNHTGDKQVADIFNICRAVEGSAFWLGLKEPSPSRDLQNQVATLIAATEASHTHKPRSLLESILMDADLLATDVADREAWWTALSEELHVEVDLQSTAMFLRCQELHTTWGLRRRAALVAAADIAAGRNNKHKEPR